MSYINAKTLRNNLQYIVEDVSNNNKEYIVIYRSKPVIKISPINANHSIPDVDKLLEIASTLGTAADASDYKEDKKTLRKRLLRKHA